MPYYLQGREKENQSSLKGVLLVIVISLIASINGEAHVFASTGQISVKMNNWNKTFWNMLLLNNKD